MCVYVLQLFCIILDIQALFNMCTYFTFTPDSCMLHCEIKYRAVCVIPLLASTRLIL